MAKAVRCWLGNHHWVVVKNPDGERYHSCSRCGKVREVYATGTAPG